MAEGGEEVAPPLEEQPPPPPPLQTSGFPSRPLNVQGSKFDLNALFGFSVLQDLLQRVEMLEKRNVKTNYEIERLQKSVAFFQSGLQEPLVSD